MWNPSLICVVFVDPSFSMDFILGPFFSKFSCRLVRACSQQIQSTVDLVKDIGQTKHGAEQAKDIGQYKPLEHFFHHCNSLFTFDLNIFWRDEVQRLFITGVNRYAGARYNSKTYALNDQLAERFSYFFRRGRTTWRDLKEARTAITKTLRNILKTV